MKSPGTAGTRWQQEAGSLEALEQPSCYNDIYRQITTKSPGQGTYKSPPPLCARSSKPNMYCTSSPLSNPSVLQPVSPGEESVGELLYHTAPGQPPIRLTAENCAISNSSSSFQQVTHQPGETANKRGFKKQGGEPPPRSCFGHGCSASALPHWVKYSGTGHSDRAAPRAFAQSLAAALKNE